MALKNIIFPGGRGVRTVQLLVAVFLLLRMQDMLGDDVSGGEAFFAGASLTTAVFIYGWLAFMALGFFRTQRKARYILKAKFAENALREAMS